MNETLEALYAFFSQFSLPVYPEDSVPDRDAEGKRIAPPYITVQLVFPDWRGSTPFYARVWYRSDNYDAIARKVDEIAAAIGEGACVPTEHGAVYISKGERFAQIQPLAGDITLKCAYLSMNLSANVFWTPPEPEPVPDVPSADDPESLYYGQTVVDGWIVNQDESEGVTALSIPDATQYRGATITVSATAEGLTTSAMARYSYTVEGMEYEEEAVITFKASEYEYDSATGQTAITRQVKVPEVADNYSFTIDTYGIKDVTVAR